MFNCNLIYKIKYFLIIMLQAVIFDYDGTLAPTQERQFDWFQYWFAHPRNSDRIGSDKFPHKDLASFMEMYNVEEGKDGGVQNVYDNLNLRCDMNDREHFVWAEYINYLEEHPNELYPGMKEAVIEIWEAGSLNLDSGRNKGLRLGINTSNVWKPVFKDLKNAGILNYFDSYVSEEILKQYHGNGHSSGIKKPSKISLALALGLIDSPGDRVLHVGDTLNDLAASQKVMRLNPEHPETLITVGVDWGYSGRSALEKGVNVEGQGTVYFDHIINKPKELVEITKKYL